MIAAVKEIAVVGMTGARNRCRWKWICAEETSDAADRKDGVEGKGGKDFFTFILN